MQKLYDQAIQSYDTLLQKCAQLSLPTDIFQANKAITIQTFTLSEFVQKTALQYPEYYLQIINRHTTSTNPTITHPTPTHLEIADNNKTHYWQNYQPQLQQIIDKAMAPIKNTNAAEIKLNELVRQFRQTRMMEIAWLDLSKKQNIESSLDAVSALADCIIIETYNCLYALLSERFGAPENQQPLLILGMGKLGGKELNFSSDIDLIFTYPNHGQTQGKRNLEHQVFFTRLAQKLIQTLDQITQYGRAYRVDMRLRPLGESGPIVLPFGAMETYYQEQGRQWERFAMQKARIINSGKYDDELMQIIRPFVYRKYIDFTTIDAIREMKELISKEVRRRNISHNIKLGKGGIREVEFFIQSIQLIHAGRYPHCQLPSILSSMHVLNEQGLIENVDISSLRQDYLLLRQVEQYLQEFNDEQTQQLPDVQTNQYRLSQLLGYPNYQTTQSAIQQAMDRINLVFANIIEDANEQTHRLQKSQNVANVNANAPDTTSVVLADTLEDIWRLDLNQSEASTMLEDMMPGPTATLLTESILRFKKKVNRSGISARALHSVNRLMPHLFLEMLPQNKNFDETMFHDQIRSIFKVLHTVCGRVTYIDLLVEHPEVRKQLLYFCRKSPWIADQIASYPILLDELLHPLYLADNNTTDEQYKNECSDLLRQTMLRVDDDDEEQVMDKLREFKHSQQLRIAAADISGKLAINRVSDKLTLLAEVIIQQVIDVAWQQITALYGTPMQSNGLPIDAVDKNFIVIAYGKFGGIELSYGSDLDLVFLHNADLQQKTTDSGSRKVLSNQEFYIKLVQRISHLCMTKTYNGVLYEIDLRLRPSGNSGLLISHVDSFFAYQLKDAWIWEHQALVRSRAISTPSIISSSETSLHNTFNTIRCEVLGLPKTKNNLKKEVFDMREKMREHLLYKNENLIDIKQCRGGIVDVEFMVQYWVLSHASMKSVQKTNDHSFASCNSITRWSDNLRLLDALAQQCVISNNTKKQLSDAYLTLRHAYHRIQLAQQKYARGAADDSKHLKQAIADVAKIYAETFQ